MLKITKDWLNPVWHRMLYSCTHMTTVDVKRLSWFLSERMYSWCVAWIVVVSVEAALKRCGNVPADDASAVDVTPVTLCIVPSLRDLLIRYVSAHICSTRYPITGLQGLPANIASSIIDYLLQERLLRPRTLQTFISWWVKNFDIQNCLSLVIHLLVEVGDC